MAYLGQRTFASFEKKVRGWGALFEEDEDLYSDQNFDSQMGMFGEDEVKDNTKEKKKEDEELSNNEFMFRGVKRTMRREGDQHLYLSPFTKEEAEPFSETSIDINGYPKVTHNDKEQSIASVMLNIMDPEPGGSFTAHYINAEGTEIQTVTHTYNPIRTSIKDGETGGHAEEKEKNASTINSSLKDPSESISDEKPDEILFEKVPTHKWNSSGIKFYRRDGEPLSSGDVYKYIKEQKSQGNQEFIIKFPRHIKGKDAEGTAPNFEIADSKYKYYNYSFDPEWGKKEEPEPEITEGDKQYIDREVIETAFVRVRTGEREKFNGLRLHDFPSPEGKNLKGKGAKVYTAGTTLNILAYGNEDAPGWIIVQTPDGQTGWTPQNWTLKAKTGDDSRYTLRFVEKGETVTELLREIEGINRDIGYDNKLFANALWLLNEDNPDVYINQNKFKQSLIDNAVKNAVDTWDAEKRAILQSIEIKQGAQVKIPTKQTIDQMIAKGEIEVRPDWVTAGIKTARIIEGIMIGIPIGIYEQAKDTVTGIWDLIKSIFSGEILDQLVDLYNALWEMDWEDVKKLLWGLLGVDPEKFDEIWNSKNITTVERYKFIGEIIGRLIFEIILILFTGGVALAKYGAKIPALAKLASSLKKVEKIIPDEVADKLRKTEKAVDKVDEAVVPPKKKKPDDDWLKYHEKDSGISGKQKYGHTKSRHVGKSEQELIERMGSSLDERGRRRMISGSSSYPDLTTAQKVISKTINENRNKIKKWLNEDSNHPLVLNHTGSEVVGKGISKNDYLRIIDNGGEVLPNDLVEMTNAKVVLKKKPNGKGYYILTSHPN